MVKGEKPNRKKKANKYSLIISDMISKAYKVIFINTLFIEWNIFFVLQMAVNSTNLRRNENLVLVIDDELDTVATEAWHPDCPWLNNKHIYIWV